MAIPFWRAWPPWLSQQTVGGPDGTTAAWRLQIVVWQNMSFQSNHPE
ncbi:hypothetical protein WAZ85_00300 (plasmid) [Escherichia coli]